MRFDDAPERFRAGHTSDQFSGASGVLFEQAMAQTRMAICLCDPNDPELPIVFANRAFRRLTGYSEEEIIGRNCRFLQGPKTDPEPVTRIRKAISNEDVVVVELLNYRKNGTTFWNALHLGPIYNDAGELVYFFGSQWDVSDVRAARAEEQHAREMARELSHRMKNMFAVISGIVNVTGRARGVQQEAAEINSRIQALGRAYETTLDDASSGSIDIGEAIKAVLLPYDRDETRLRLEGNGVRMPFTVISIVGLFCTSWRPTRPSMARGPWRRAKWWSTGNCRMQAMLCWSHGTNRAAQLWMAARLSPEPGRRLLTACSQPLKGRSNGIGTKPGSARLFQYRLETFNGENLHPAFARG